VSCRVIADTRRLAAESLLTWSNIGSIIHTEGPTPGPSATDWADTFDEFQAQAMKTRLGIPLLIPVDAVHGQNTLLMAGQIS
jgi:beta-glucosidase-like glycosyl hydrolase